MKRSGSREDDVEESSLQDDGGGGSYAGGGGGSSSSATIWMKHAGRRQPTTAAAGVVRAKARWEPSVSMLRAFAVDRDSASSSEVVAMTLVVWPRGQLGEWNVDRPP